MLEQIKKNEVVENIMAGHNVFVVKETVNVNDMSLGEIANLPSDTVFLLAKKKLIRSTTENKFVDTRKFTRMLHDRNIFQTELAKLAGVNSVTISALIYHKNKPRVDTLKKICDVLKCEPNEILED